MRAETHPKQFAKRYGAIHRDDIDEYLYVVNLGELDAAGMLKPRTSRQDCVYFTDTPSDNTDALFTAPTGYIIKIWSAVGYAQCDDTVADRTFQIQTMQFGTVPSAVITQTHNSAPVTLSASQEGSIAQDNVSEGNDNGTVANPTGEVHAYYLYPGDTIQAMITANKQTGDRTQLRVIYERVAVI